MFFLKTYICKTYIWTKTCSKWVLWSFIYEFKYIWFDILSKYIDNFCVTVSVAAGIFSERVTDTSCQDFSLWFFCVISLAMVKMIWKASSEESVFSDLACHFFVFLYLCHSPTTYYSWILFLQQNVVHCVLSFWLVCVMLRRYMLMFFQYLWISSQIEPDVTLYYHCMQTLELV